MHNVHHVNFRICMNIEVNGLVWNSHSTELCLSAWLKYDSIFANILNSRSAYYSHLLTLHCA